MILPFVLMLGTTCSAFSGPKMKVDPSSLIALQKLQVRTAPVAISPDDRGPGVGKWIYLKASAGATAVRFRKTIILNERPSQVRGWLSGDVRYRLWINGRLASRGPADPGRDYDSGPPGPWFEDVRDLTPLFHIGHNVVTAEVFQIPLVGSESPTQHPGFKLDLKFPKFTVGTDQSWRVAPSPDLDQTGAQHGFRIDMKLEPAGWRDESFDDRNWAFADLAARNNSQTLISELAAPMEIGLKPVGLARISPGVDTVLTTGGARFRSDGSYSVRYGQVLSGYVGLTVRGHVGSKLLIMPNEHDAPGVSRGAEILLREGVQTVDLPFMDSFSVINIKAENVTLPIEIERVHCTFTSYPVQYLGQFECSRADWNRLWDVCRWVTQICMQTHYLDSPNHQEPVSDAGDYLIESLNSFYAFGDGTLAAQDLKKIGRTLKGRNYQSFHTSYSLLWLRMQLQYLAYTGDSAPIKELAPDSFALLDRFKSYIGPNGLISQAPNYMFMDWVEIEGFTAHHPPAVIGQGYMTALYYRALEDGIKVAEIVNDEGRVKEFQSLRSQIAAAFERELWVPEKGLYRDGKPFQTTVLPNQWLPADKEIETFTTQVNTFAVTCGLADRRRAGEIMNTLLSRPDLKCQPYFMHFVFEAIEKSGLFDRVAASQIDRWKIVPDTQSFLEMWDTGDLSHAWNATLLFQMSGRVLGVEPLESGFVKFSISPHKCGLSWAKGKVPTPHGLIQVEWKKADGGVKLHFTVPKGTEAVVGASTFSPGTHDVVVLSNS